MTEQRLPRAEQGEQGEQGEQAVRVAIRGWLAGAWDPDMELRAWRDLLVGSGWACPSWPVGLWGRGLGPGEAAAAADELRCAGAVGPAVGVGMGLVAPTLLEHGSESLNRRLLRTIATGEQTWCQLFSEPGYGSDLAGLATSAVRDGDEWVVSGQKVWTTGAVHAAFGLLLARTDWSAPKHAGITAFAFPMDQSGVEVRPLRQMNGHASFNEVFLTDARVPHANVIGAVNGGWAVARTTLAHERQVITTLFALMPGPAVGRAADEARAEAAAYFKTYEWYPQRQGRADLAPVRAAATGRASDAVTRQHLARLHSLERIADWTGRRSRAARMAGTKPGPEGSVTKLAASDLARAAAEVHTGIAGAHGMLTGADDPTGGVVAEILVSTPAQSIAGGTDEIQRNIIGEKVLGLPREPDPDRDRPYGTSMRRPDLNR